MTPQEELEKLHAEIARCTNCPLHATRKNAVPGEGAVDARVMFVGEAPGAKEDELGRPFVGRSGELLTELIEGVGFSRDEVFITSVLKSRPPNNRTPKKSEVDACISYLDRQLEIINPEVVVLLGGVAVASLIGPWKMTDAHGRFYEGSKRKFFITYHPAAALRFPATKKVMRADFEKLRRELG
ncbi:MAG: uracil-DNA glycosylase [Candidatus Thorarchaeota archaeon]|nr:uracil-DNA glycosylase [Candidatus Thorarchaeota archaeon]